MCRPMEPNPNSKIFMCPTVVNLWGEMPTDSELGHTFEQAVNQSAPRIVGFIYAKAHIGATCCASSPERVRPELPRKSCCRIHSVVICALYGFLTVMCGRATSAAESRTVQPVRLTETSHHHERKIPTCRRFIYSAPRPVCWQPQWCPVPELHLPMQIRPIPRRPKT